ncbi:MAG: AMED_5909 family protein [Pseudonocardiaceae bacterium]
MTLDKTTKPVTPQTLAEAHEALARIQPRQKAPLTEWLVYYQRSAALYADIAEIDRGHHHESLFWADHERECAKEIKAQITIPDDNEVHGDVRQACIDYGEHGR